MDEQENEVAEIKKCVDCDYEFNVYAGELAWLKERFGDTFSAPIRCKKCRILRKKLREESR